MKGRDIALTMLIVSTWFLEDFYHLFGKDLEITPYPFSDEATTLRWYVFDISNYVRLMILSICLLLIREKPHWITRDSVIITVMIMVFSLFWYLVYYGNPFYKQEIWIKVVVTVGIYIVIRSVRWYGKRGSNSVSGRGPVRRDN